MKRRWLLAIPVVLLAAPGLWWVYVVNASEFEARTTIREFHVPSGFTGWATVKFGVTGAPPLKVTADGMVKTTIIPFPIAGLLETNDPLPKGHSTPRWFKADRGGAVLIRWDPPPFFLVQRWSARCFHVYVTENGHPPDQDPPPIPERGCDQ